MTNTPNKKQRKSQRGTALLIAIFSLLLISAVAIGLIMMSGMESSIDANYKRSTQVYYNAKAGLEEARGRLSGLSPNPLTASGFPPVTGPLLPPGQAWYIINPAAGEVVAPGNGGNAYADTQYAQEWANTPFIVPVVQPYINSVASLAGTPNAPYKWVRITATTEKSANVDVNNDTVKDPATPLVFDGNQVLLSTQITPNPTFQVYTITSLAVLPTGAQRIEEYLAAPVQMGLSFPSALTLAGSVGNFNGANSNQYYMDGRDGSGNPPPVPGCIPNQPAKPAIGVTAGADPNHAGSTNEQYVENNLPRPTHYETTDPVTGNTVTGTQAVSSVAMNSNLQSPANLANLLQTLHDNADATIPNNGQPFNPSINNSGTTYNFGGAGWPADMSQTNPKVVFVDGSFDLGPNTGYGILVVTGNFIYHGNSAWKGIIMVVGDGTTTFDGLGGGNGEFDGAVYVATIRDAAGNLLPNLGTTNFDISGGGGNGIYYNSCWVNSVQKPPAFRILSFREISN